MRNVDHRMTVVKSCSHLVFCTLKKQNGPSAAANSVWHTPTRENETEHDNEDEGYGVSFLVRACVGVCMGVWLRVGCSRA